MSLCERTLVFKNHITHKRGCQKNSPFFTPFFQKKLIRQPRKTDCQKVLYPIYIHFFEF